MDLQLTWRGDYAMRAAVALAHSWDDGSYRKIREVAEEMGIPQRYTPEILGILQRAGLAQARAGRNGGYRLSREPSAISLLEVIEASEGNLRSQRCVMSGGPCHWETVCAVHPMLEAAANALTSSLRSVTLDSVVNFDRDLWKSYFTSPSAAAEQHGV
jgi:Rrf2 family protein